MPKYETVTLTLTADKVKKGDYVTYCGESFVASEVSRDEVSGLMRFGVLSRMPQYVAPEREVKVQRTQQVKPYVVLTRRYYKSGKCRKGRHTFATEAQQQRFISTTTAAVTYHN